jgi:hypothetical protein
MTPDDPFNEGPEAARARKRRSIAIAVGLLAFMVLVFWVTILKMSGSGAHG